MNRIGVVGMIKDVLEECHVFCRIPYILVVGTK